MSTNARWSALIDKHTNAIVAKIKTLLPDGSEGIATDGYDFNIDIKISDKDSKEAHYSCTLPVAYLIDDKTMEFELFYPDY